MYAPCARSWRPPRSGVSGSQPVFRQELDVVRPWRRDGAGVQALALAHLKRGLGHRAGGVRVEDGADLLDLVLPVLQRLIPALVRLLDHSSRWSGNARRERVASAWWTAGPGSARASRRRRGRWPCVIPAGIAFSTSQPRARPGPLPRSAVFDLRRDLFEAQRVGKLLAGRRPFAGPLTVGQTSSSAVSPAAAPSYQAPPVAPAPPDGTPSRELPVPAQSAGYPRELPRH